LVRERVAVVAEYDRAVRSPSREVRLPAVVALTRYRRTRQDVPFTRYNVFLRDRFTCQYCHGVRPASQLTFDHVRPRSMGGVTSWENVVAACGPCNVRKGSSMRMQPIVMPKMPSARDLMRARKGLPMRHLHESWLDYLYWDAELDQ
jgi:5-methylcytosine-specific restriction endonuclease McrA